MPWPAQGREVRQNWRTNTAVSSLIQTSGAAPFSIVYNGSSDFFGEKSSSTDLIHPLHSA